MKNFVLGLVVLLILIAVIVLFKRIGADNPQKLKNLDESSLGSDRVGDTLPQ